MTEQPADYWQRLAERQGTGSEGVSEIIGNVEARTVPGAVFPKPLTDAEQWVIRSVAGWCLDRCT